MANHITNVALSIRNKALSDANIQFVIDEIWGMLSVKPGINMRLIKNLLTRTKIRDEMSRTLASSSISNPRDTMYVDPVDELSRLNRSLINGMYLAYGEPDPHYNPVTNKYEYADWGLDVSSLTHDMKYKTFAYGDNTDRIDFKVDASDIRLTKIDPSSAYGAEYVYKARDSRLNDRENGFQHYKPEMSFINNPFNRHSPYFKNALDRTVRNFGSRTYGPEIDDDQNSQLPLVTIRLGSTSSTGTDIASASATSWTSSPAKYIGDDTYMSDYEKLMQQRPVAGGVTSKWETPHTAFQYGRAKKFVGPYPMRNSRYLAGFYDSSDDCGLYEKESIHRSAFDTTQKPLDFGYNYEKVQSTCNNNIDGQTSSLGGSYPSTSVKGRQPWRHANYNEPYPGFQEQLYKFGYYGLQ